MSVACIGIDHMKQLFEEKKFSIRKQSKFCWNFDQFPTRGLAEGRSLTSL